MSEINLTIEKVVNSFGSESLSVRYDKKIRDVYWL